MKRGGEKVEGIGRLFVLCHITKGANAEDVLLMIVVEETLTEKGREEVRTGEGRGRDVAVDVGSLLKKTLVDGRKVQCVSVEVEKVS